MADTYAFNPSSLLSWDAIRERAAKMAASGKGPAQLAMVVSCGAYNPITTAHVRMLQTAMRYLNGTLAEDEAPLYEVAPTPLTHTIPVGAFISPVSDHFKKNDLAPFTHRKAVCERVLKGTGIAVDDWEGTRGQYERTFTVLSHIRREVRAHYAATASSDEERHMANGIDCYFLCGGDLFESFYQSGVWDLNLLEKIFREFRLLVVARVGSQDPLATISTHNTPLTHPSTPDTSLDLRIYQERVHTLRIPANSTSSTQVRALLRSGTDPKTLSAMLSEDAVKYLIENKVYV